MGYLLEGFFPVRGLAAPSRARPRPGRSRTGPVRDPPGGVPVVNSSKFLRGVHFFEKKAK